MKIEKKYTRNKKINLPDIILEGKDLYVRKGVESKINFISNKIIIGKILDYKKAKLNTILHSIVCIENADPGYDFLFSKNIKGLVYKIRRAKFTYGNQMCRIKSTCLNRCRGADLY